MAKARMLHKSISVSIQVNKLSLPARILFTWMISHADDEGRLKGEPEYIRGIVMPLTNWSLKKTEKYIREIQEGGLIYWWKQNGELFIEFIRWNNFQSIRKNRAVPSFLPSYPNTVDDQMTTIRQPDISQKPSQDNKIEPNLIEIKKSESNVSESSKEEGISIKTEEFTPKSESELAAYATWKRLEPDNTTALQTTYLKAHRRGLPPDKFFVFSSEIKQDRNIKNPGAVFNKKVADYFLNEKGK